ncbi:MAG: hypothetical protein QOK29_3005, partial [Rhodospirillaceae bacterium]|nr:hypothetical protein [Rhodospirillaceae bacterium]
MRNEVKACAFGQFGHPLPYTDTPAPRQIRLDHVGAAQADKAFEIPICRDLFTGRDRYRTAFADIGVLVEMLRMYEILYPAESLLERALALYGFRMFAYLSFTPGESVEKILALTTYPSSWVE